MSALHPNWESTDRAPERVSVQEETPEKEHTPVRVAGIHVSRRPAMFAGIALVLALGFGFVEGVEDLRGSLARQVSITITDHGFSPAHVQVEHGQEISWINRSSSLHTIQSKTLCSQRGCLEVGPILSGDSFATVISSDVSNATYTYASKETPSLSGIIRVIPNAYTQPEETNTLEASLLAGTVSGPDTQNGTGGVAFWLLVFGALCGVYGSTRKFISQEG